MKEAITAGHLLAGRYQMDGPVGRGGMATVWRGFDLRLHRPVAVKVLDPAVFAELGMRRRFLREAQTVAGLAHPNIVAVHDAAVDEDAGYVVMELVDGPSVEALIAQRGRLPVNQAIDIAIQVCAALATAHAAAVVHRDITPANVLLTSTGVVKVCDFGIAAWRQSAYPSMVGGTRGYMAPEQANGGPIDARTDVYGLGCLLHAMVLGHAPDQPPQSFGSHDPNLPEELAEVLRQLLATDPDARPQTANEVADRLAAIGVDAPGTGHRQPGRHAVAEHVVGVATVPPPVLNPTLVTPSVAASPARERWLRPVLWAGAVVAVLGLLALIFATLPRGGTNAAVVPGGSAAGSSPAGSAASSDQPAQLLAAFHAEIDVQNAAGALDRGKAQDLHKRVDEVRESLDENDRTKAGEKLRELSNRLTELRSDGKLTDAGYVALRSFIDRLGALVGPAGGE